MSDLTTLAARIEAGSGTDNALDVLVEIAVFKPDRKYKAVRANSAGTKVIYTRWDGSEHTCWAWDWTMQRSHAAATLRARSNDHAD